jgi:hypothetical protein
MTTFEKAVAILVTSQCEGHFTSSRTRLQLLLKLHRTIGPNEKVVVDLAVVVLALALCYSADLTRVDGDLLVLLALPALEAFGPLPMSFPKVVAYFAS